MRKDIWLFLFAIGVVLFGWPAMGIFESSLVVYLFSAWVVFIVLIAAATVYFSDDGGGGG